MTRSAEALLILLTGVRIEVAGYQVGEEGLVGACHVLWTGF
jgi:hypothetical protein